MSSVGAPGRDARWRARVRRRLVAVLAAALVLAPCAARGEESIHEVEAEMLFNLAKFVEWPPHAGSQMTFIILGEDDLAGVIASVLSRKTINGRDVFVRCVRRVEDVKGGQILFIASSEAKRIPEVLESLRGHSVLTVAETTGFAAQGGMVELVRQDGKVRFEINPGSAELAKLKISAKLLALAKIVAHAP